MRKILLTICTTCAFFALSAICFGQKTNSAQLPEVNLNALDGTGVDVEAQRGKVVVLAIGASWLPLSRQQAVIANKLSRKFAGKDVLIYFVATDSTNSKSKNFASDEQLRAFATRTKLLAPILRDSDGARTLKKFGVDQIPAFVILDKEGKRAIEPFGGLDPDAEATDLLATQIASEVTKLL